MVELSYIDTSAAESGDYYQIHFGSNLVSSSENEPYFLIQRGFEDEKEDGGDLFYLETNRKELIDHYEITQATLTRNSLYMHTTNADYPEFLIEFKSNIKRFTKLKRIFGIMFEGIPS